MAWVYKIVRISDGSCYVGHTSRKPGARWGRHRFALNKGTHHARYLQNAWRKHGADAFRFEIIEQCDEAEKLKREQYWIDQLNPRFNVAKVAGSILGYKFTEEQRQRRMGHPVSDETKAKIANSALGNQKTKGLKWSDKARRNMSKAVKGKPRSAAQRAATLRSLELARLNARVNKPGMNWRLLRQSEGQGNLFE